MYCTIIFRVLTRFQKNYSCTVHPNSKYECCVPKLCINLTSIKYNFLRRGDGEMCIYVYIIDLKKLSVK